MVKFLELLFFVDQVPNKILPKLTDAKSHFPVVRQITVDPIMMPINYQETLKSIVDVRKQILD